MRAYERGPAPRNSEVSNWWFITGFGFPLQGGMPRFAKIERTNWTGKSQYGE